MNEKEKSKKRETQSEITILDKNTKLSLDSRKWDLTKNSTQASNNLNWDTNLTQTSVQNIYGENKFKIQYETVKKEEHSDKAVKRSFKLKINIDHKEISKLKKSTICDKKESTNIINEFVEVKAKSDNILISKDFNKISNTDRNCAITNYKFSKSFKGFNNKKVRKDAFGEKINKENKKIFKVSFIDFLQDKDEIKNLDYVDPKNKKSTVNLNAYTYNFGVAEINNRNRQFIEVIKVESYKKYNCILNEEEDGKVVCRPCGCCIF